jgi:hypothetical protein
MKEAAPRAAKRRGQQKETDAARLASTLSAVKCGPIDNFLRHPDLQSFQAAFPSLVGRDLSFSDFLEFNQGSLPEPQNFIGQIYDALDDDFVPINGANEESELEQNPENKQPIEGKLYGVNRFKPRQP